ncbi:MAG: RtcB family protein, partial [Candidatus Anstonellales archaeon]
MHIQQVDEYKFKIPRQGHMRTDAYVFASDRLLTKMREDRTLAQLMNVASLPSIIDYPSVMPDAHEGYGFPIGGVAAFTEIVSPGGVGFDINCGVRLLDTGLDRESVMPKIRELVEKLYKNIPAGLGEESSIRLKEDELDNVLELGVKWA